MYFGSSWVRPAFYDTLLWALCRCLAGMAVSLALLPGEFVLSGGHLKKSMIGTGLTTVGAKQFVLLKKGERWLTWFTTGSGV